MWRFVRQEQDLARHHLDCESCEPGERGQLVAGELVKEGLKAVKVAWCGTAVVDQRFVCMWSSTGSAGTPGSTNWFLINASGV